MNKIFSIILILVTAISLKAQTNDTLPTTLNWVKLDSEAEFPGGLRALQWYWQQNFRCRRCGKTTGEGKIEFTITEDGSIRDIQIKQPLSPATDEAARIAVVKMPRWKPAYYKGKPITSSHTITYWQETYNFWTGNNIQLPIPDTIKKFYWSFGFGIGGI